MGAALWLGLAKILGALIDEEIAPLNPVMFATVGALLFATVVLASVLPAMTAAMRRNPADLLRVV